MTTDHRALGHCQIVTTTHQKIRRQPGGKGIEWTPVATALSPAARNVDWFEDAFRGLAGWMGARYVSPSGDCGGAYCASAEARP